MNEITTVFGIVTVPAIIIICYILGAVLKAINNDTLSKFIPSILGVFGGAIGIVVFYTIPNYLPAENWLLAFAVGAASGLATVGINQIYKQFTKEEYIEGIAEDEEPVDEEPDKEA